MVEDNLSRIDESATKSTYKLGVDFDRCKDKGEKNAPKFIPRSTYHQEEKITISTKAHYPSNSKPSFNPKRKVRKETPKLSEEAFFACFVAVRVTWMSFASGARGLSGGALIMPEIYIVMSFLIFRLALSLTLYLTFLLALCLSSLIDLTITHMVLVHDRTALSLDALVTAHVNIMVIISHVALFFLLEGLTLTLS
jgi:hypothetical protein